LPDDEAAHRPGRLTSSNLIAGEEESIKMSYIPPILTFLLVLSPLYIPVGVTIVHAIETWRSRSSVPLPTIVRERRRLQGVDQFS
jgi:hypothetical protein